MASIPPSLPAIVTTTSAPRAASAPTAEERAERLRKAIVEDDARNARVYDSLAHR